MLQRIFISDQSHEHSAEEFFVWLCPEITVTKHDQSCEHSAEEFFVWLCQKRIH